MHVDAPAIEAFLTVAERGSTHAGARDLGISQASISRRISRLEAQLGTPLFLRSGHSLALSAAGQQFLPTARSHFADLKNALNEIRMSVGGQTNTVVFACLATLGLDVLPNVLAELAQIRPDLRVRLLDVMPSQIEQTVSDGTADFAVTMLGIGAPDLIHEVAMEQPLALVVPDSHPLATRGTMPWSEIDGMRLIGMGPASAHFRLLESARPQIKVQWEEFHQVQRITTAIAMVAAGLGAAILPLNLALNRPFRVQTILLTDPVISRRIGILRRSATPLSQHADFLRRRIISALRKGYIQPVPPQDPDQFANNAG